MVAYGAGRGAPGGLHQPVQSRDRELEMRSPGGRGHIENFRASLGNGVTTG